MIARRPSFSLAVAFAALPLLGSADIAPPAPTQDTYDVRPWTTPLAARERARIDTLPDTTGSWESPAPVKPPVKNAGIAAELRASISRIQGVFRRAPALAPPHRAEIAVGVPAWRVIDAVGNDGTVPGPQRWHQDYLIFVPTRKIAGEAQAAVRVSVNGPEAALVPKPESFGWPVAEDPVGRIYRAPLQVGTLHGFPVYENGAVVLTHNDRPLFVPVSRERWLRVRMAAARKELDEAERTAAQPTTYETWMAGRAERRRGAEEGARTLEAVVSKEKGQEHRALMEKAERENEQRLHQNEAEERALRAKVVARQRGALTALEQELAGLTPDQRAAAAYFECSERASHACAPGDRDWAHARPLVSINPIFFDRTRPPSSVQLIVVSSWHATGDLHNPWSHDLVARTFETLDWNALANELDR